MEETSTAIELDPYARDFNAPIELAPASTALVIVDLQYSDADRHSGLGAFKTAARRDADVAYRFDRQEQVVIPNVKRLLECFRRHRMRVIHLRIGAALPDASDMPPCWRPIAIATNAIVGQHEHDFLEAVKPKADELVVNKRSASPFNTTAIDNVLRNLRIETLIVVGVSTNMCVESTVRDAADRGYGVIVVEDCCGADTPDYHEASLRSMSRVFARVVDLAHVLEVLDCIGKSQPTTHAS